MASIRTASASVGVFDSGVGGLTVLRALVAALPGEDFVYLGDTARLPYGTKSADSVRRYALQAADVLRSRGVKCLVVACNTASAVALDALAGEFAPVPVVGVLEPGAAAACAASRSGRIAVIATEGTVRGGAYEAAIRRRRPEAVVASRACPLFVALAEEGLSAGPIVDSASTTAAAVGEILHAQGLARPAAAARGTIDLLATDGPERFARVGAGFLGRPVAVSDVTVVDL